MANNAGPVLAATDLEASSDRAVERAALLADIWGVPLKLIHVASGAVPDNPAEAEAAVRSAVPAAAADAQILLATGSAPREIARVAGERECRLIVTGIPAYNQLGDYITGTAVDHIVRHAAQPVLVVRQQARSPYRSILVATDLSDCSRAALETAAAFFPDAEIHIVHAFHLAYGGWIDDEDNREDLEEHVQREFQTFIESAAIGDTVRRRLRPVLEEGEATSVVVEAAERLEPDLVVLGTHGRSGLARAVLGSTASHLLDVLCADTMMVREPAAKA